MTYSHWRMEKRAKKKGDHAGAANITPVKTLLIILCTKGIIHIVMTMLYV